MTKILVTALSFSKYSKEPIEILKKAGCEVVWNPTGLPLNEDQLCQLVADCEGIIVGVDPITRQVLEAGKKLKVVAKHGVGVDNIDIQAAALLGIQVTNGPDTNSEAVADLTFGLLLAAARSIPFADKSTREGKWPRLVGPELYRKKLGILGLGAIGKRVAKRATGFSMEILAYDVYQDTAFAAAHNVRYASLEEVLRESDFVTLNLPLLPDTREIINERTLAMMKPNAYLVNTARGELIDERALCKALKSGQLAGAALDAFIQEPPPADLPLLQLPNVVVTPHMGAYSYEANRNMGMAAAVNILAVLRGETPPNLVKPK
ncbi:MAG: phosphoglycerate dehydrogenase [Bacillota bacterium]